MSISMLITIFMISSISYISSAQFGDDCGKVIQGTKIHTNIFQTISIPKIIGGLILQTTLNDNQSPSTVTFVTNNENVIATTSTNADRLEINQILAAGTYKLLFTHSVYPVNYIIRVTCLSVPTSAPTAAPTPAPTAVPSISPKSCGDKVEGKFKGDRIYIPYNLFFPEYGRIHMNIVINNMNLWFFTYVIATPDKDTLTSGDCDHPSCEVKYDGHNLSAGQYYIILIIHQKAPVQVIDTSYTLTVQCIGLAPPAQTVQG